MAWFRFLRCSGSRASAGAALLATLLGACGPQLPGVVSADGYASGRYALGVSKGYDAPAAAGLMADGWKLDNFNGETPKEGDAYQTTFHVDVDGDGDFDWDATEPAFELRFVHLRHAGVVWLRAVPVSHELAKQDLHVLVTSYLEGLAGGEYETLELSSGNKATVEKRFASTLSSAESCRLAANECEAATIELANVDQLRLDPQYRSHKLRVVIARTSFAYTPRGRGPRGPSYPVYLLAGYSNQPSQFEAGLKDFAGLLQHVEIDGHHGFETTAPSAPIAGPAPVTAPLPAAPAPAPAPPAVEAPAPTLAPSTSP